MAKYETTVRGSLQDIADRMHSGIMGGSVSASFEDESYFEFGIHAFLVRVYERYSYAGGNRLSCTLSFASEAGSNTVRISAITSGGSQAMFFKINTFGEAAFLDEVIRVIGTL